MPRVLPTQRRRRSDPNATSQTRSRPCGDASSSLSPRTLPNTPFTDAVRLALSVPSQCQGTPAANASLLTWEINSCDQHSRDLED